MRNAESAKVTQRCAEEAEEAEECAALRGRAGISSSAEAASSAGGPPARQPAGRRRYIGETPALHREMPVLHRRDASAV